MYLRGSDQGRDIITHQFLLHFIEWCIYGTNNDRVPLPRIALETGSWKPAWHINHCPNINQFSGYRNTWRQITPRDRVEECGFRGRSEGETSGRCCFCFGVCRVFRCFFGYRLVISLLKIRLRFRKNIDMFFYFSCFSCFW